MRQQRPGQTLGPQTLQCHLRTYSKVYEASRGPEQTNSVWLGHPAASRSQDHGFRRSELLRQRSLQTAEITLAAVAKDLVHRATLPTLDLLVEIEKPRAQGARGGAAGGTLARA